MKLSVSFSISIDPIPAQDSNEVSGRELRLGMREGRVGHVPDSIDGYVFGHLLGRGVGNEGRGCRG